MRAYWRPGATPLERLEAYMASHLCSRPEISRQVAELLIWATDSGHGREKTIREAFTPGAVADPAEAMGVARAVLLLCGVVPEKEELLIGHPKKDLTCLLAGDYRPRDLGSPSAYAVPSLVDAYCHMGAGFARGVDRVFRAVTGQALIEHLRRALALLEPPDEAARISV